MTIDLGKERSTPRTGAPYHGGYMCDWTATMANGLVLKGQAFTGGTISSREYAIITHVNGKEIRGLDGNPHWNDTKASAPPHPFSGRYRSAIRNVIRRHTGMNK